MTDAIAITVLKSKLKTLDKAKVDINKHFKNTTSTNSLREIMQTNQ